MVVRGNAGVWVGLTSAFQGVVSCVGCGNPLIVVVLSPVWTLREHVRLTVLIVTRKRLRVGYG